MRSDRLARTGSTILSTRSGRRYVSGGAPRPVQAATHDAHTDEQQSSSISNSPSRNPGITGSAKLLADALLEEESSSSGLSDATERTSARAARLVQAQSEENWTGDENIRDAVLRMLVDKYKPLRGPGIRSAEEKIRERPPTVRPASSPPPSLESDMDSALYSSSSGADTTLKMGHKSDWTAHAAEPLLPGIEGHRPWHTTFTPPSSSTARIKSGRFTPSSARRSAVPGSEETVKIDIAAARRSATAQRLGRARESTLDYRLSVSRTPGSRDGGSRELRRPMPLDPKGWASLVEERIERARLEGQFRTLNGRGKPIVQETAEKNPFIAREEFLMNRIVQRNQAAPPWVELQSELENAIQTFRTLLIQAWTRRAIRLLTATRPAPSLGRLTLTDARALRDESWAAREAGYHATALGEVNELVRRYNGVAPYAVRKPYFVKERELEKAYWESGEGVLEGVRERLRKGGVERSAGEGSGFGDEDGGCGGGDSAVSRRDEKKGSGVWKMVRGWIADLRKA